MRQLILTAIGNDRAGLVAELSDVIKFHGGNWEHSEMAELGGTFAGVVQVSVPDGRLDAFVADLDELDGDLDVQVRLGLPDRSDGESHVRLELVADDRPGIVNDIASALARVGASIQRLDTETRPAPMAGGDIFALQATVALADNVDRDTVRDVLEALSHELIVEFDDD